MSYCVCEARLSRRRAALWRFHICRSDLLGSSTLQPHAAFLVFFDTYAALLAARQARSGRPTARCSALTSQITESRLARQPALCSAHCECSVARVLHTEQRNLSRPPLALPHPSPYPADQLLKSGQHPPVRQRRCAALHRQQQRGRAPQRLLRRRRPRPGLRKRSLRPPHAAGVRPNRQRLHVHRLPHDPGAVSTVVRVRWRFSPHHQWWGLLSDAAVKRRYTWGPALRHRLVDDGHHHVHPLCVLVRRSVGRWQLQRQPPADAASTCWARVAAQRVERPHVNHDDRHDAVRRRGHLHAP